MGIEILAPPIQYLCQLAENGIAGPGPLRSTFTGLLFVEGWALCIKKSIFQELGGWSEDYGLGYWEDLDLCYRAQLAGYSLRYALRLGEAHQRSPNLLMCHVKAITGTDGRIDREALKKRNIKLFIQKFFPYLRDVNLIVFPDWTQPEESLTRELSQVIRAVLNHPDKKHLSLLIETSDLDEQDAMMLISAITMKIFLEEELTIDDSEEYPCHCLGKTNNLELATILNLLHGRIFLEHENKGVLENFAAENIPVITYDILNLNRAIEREDGPWKFC